VGDFLQGCSALGVPNGLDVVDCGRAAGNQHGFLPRNSKTDNYKVGQTNNLEIDTQFLDDATGNLLNGIQAIWTDTLGVSNNKYSYTKMENLIDHIAHVEAVEQGVHGITVLDQPGCKVVKFFCYNTKNFCSPDINGQGTINVTIRNNDPNWTKHLYVYCNTAP